MGKDEMKASSVYCSVLVNSAPWSSVSFIFLFFMLPNLLRGYLPNFAGSDWPCCLGTVKEGEPTGHTVKFGEMKTYATGSEQPEG